MIRFQDTIDVNMFERAKKAIQVEVLERFQHVVQTATIGFEDTIDIDLVKDAVHIHARHNAIEIHMLHYTVNINIM